MAVQPSVRPLDPVDGDRVQGPQGAAEGGQAGKRRRTGGDDDPEAEVFDLCSFPFLELFVLLGNLRHEVVKFKECLLIRADPGVGIGDASAFCFVRHRWELM